MTNQSIEAGLMRFGSVCSGIEAASVAWAPIGWKAAWLAEIEPFPCGVLAHHYPDVANLGDMTAIARRVLTGEVEAPDVLTGGTPCQAFSVAGLRESLADARGNLTLKFVELADAIDHVRGRAGKPASVVIWENVPGVLSTKDNAFGCFLAGLAGEDDALEPPGGRWADSGCVYGPQRAVAWRTLDAQYFGLAQRRRRVFVVASARTDFDPAQVLFEWQGLRRDSPPSREAGQGTAATLDARTQGGGFPGTDGACGGHVVPVTPTLTATYGEQCGQDYMNGLMAFSATDYESGAFARVDQAAPLTTSADRTRAAPVIAFGAKDHGGDATEDLAPTLRAGGHAGSHANAGVMPAITFQQEDTYAGAYEADAASVLSTLRDEVGAEAVAQWGSRVLDSLQSPEVLRSWLRGEGVFRASEDFRSFVEHRPLPRAEGVPARTLRQVWEQGPDGRSPQGRGLAKQLAFELGEALSELPSIDAFSESTVHHLRERAQGARLLRQALSAVPALGRRAGGEGEPAHAALQVRRLTPTECERLMGFPDNYTAIPWRGKPASECPDGPRYKALGNSWAVPVARWVGQRIHLVLEVA